MNCETIRSEILGALPGPLPARCRPAVRTHLRDCAACRDHWRQQRKVLRLLQQWSPIEAPWHPQALDQPLAGPPAAPARRRRPVLLGLAAGVVAFLALTIPGAELQIGGGGLRLQWGNLPLAADSDPAVDLQLAAAMEQVSDHLRGAELRNEQRFQVLVRTLATIHEESQRNQQALGDTLLATHWNLAPRVP